MENALPPAKPWLPDTAVAILKPIDSDLSHVFRGTTIASHD